MLNGVALGGRIDSHMDHRRLGQVGLNQNRAANKVNEAIGCVGSFNRNREPNRVSIQHKTEVTLLERAAHQRFAAPASYEE